MEKSAPKIMLCKMPKGYSFEPTHPQTFIPKELDWTSPDPQMAMDLAGFMGYPKGSYGVSEVVQSELSNREDAFFGDV